MKSLVFAGLCLAALSTASAASAANPQLEAPIRNFIDAFNRGDVPGAERTHLGDASIIDEVPPYIWKSPNAFSKWVADLTAYDAAMGITEEHVTLGPVTRELVSGAPGHQSAYVIVSVTYTFKQKGVAMHEPAQMTFALRDNDGWRISGWTWTGPDPTPK